MKGLRPNRVVLRTLIVVVFLFLAGFEGQLDWAFAAGDPPQPLLKRDHPVDWWFVFKFNAKAFPGCGDNEDRQCPFGGEVQSYALGQQFVFASSEHLRLQKGGGCVVGTTRDPLGATFEAIYNGNFYYVVWHDQFYDDPAISGCAKACASPWGHSKGMLAWNEAGEAEARGYGSLPLRGRAEVCRSIGEAESLEGVVSSRSRMASRVPSGRAR